MAAISTIARLCEPSSELHIAEDWYRRTALEDLLGVPTDQVNDDRLLRPASAAHERDRAAPAAAARGAVRARLRPALYDVTSTYFEGQALGNPQAKHGHTRDHRPDCMQVCIALVVTREGIPLGYEVFDGNRVDVTTVEEIVGTMEARFGIAGRVWVMDRGMTSAANIAWLQKTGRRYLIGTPKSDLKKFAAQITDTRDWQTVREGVEAKLCAGPDGNETLVLSCAPTSVANKRRRCTNASPSASRKDYEDSSAASLVPASLSTAAQSSVRSDACSAATHAPRDASSPTCWTIRVRARSCACNGPRGPSATIGRATARAVTCCAATSTTGRPRRSGRPTCSSPRRRRAISRSGRSGITSRTACRRTSSFASWPTRCGRRSSRWQKRAGLGNSPRTILYGLGRIQSTDVVLPLARDPQRELRIRRVVRPNGAQAALLDRLGLRLPDRLRPASSACEM